MKLQNWDPVYDSLESQQLSSPNSIDTLPPDLAYHFFVGLGFNPNI